MITLLLPIILLLVQPPPPEDAKGDHARQRVGTRIEFAQLTVRQRIIVRVPRMEESRRTVTVVPIPPLRWDEKKAPKCLMLGRIVGTAISNSQSVDLLTDDGVRYRAKFNDSCPAIDFYTGIYVKPAPDGMICAKRDAIRSRSGDACRIQQFRSLVRKR